MIVDINSMTRLTYKFDEVLDRVTSPQLVEIIKNSEEYHDTYRKIMKKFADDFIEAKIYIENYHWKAKDLYMYVKE